MHEFWNEPTPGDLLGGGGWMDSGMTGDNDAHAAAAAVYVPHHPGYNRVFTHVSKMKFMLSMLADFGIHAE